MAADAESASTRWLRWGSELAELGWVPDVAIRRVIRRLCAERLASERAAGPAAQAELVDALRRGPIAVATGRANEFEPQTEGFAAGNFDRVVSIEMFEHIRNWEALLGRVARWLAPDGRAFLHYFCHRDLVYRFEDQGPNDWMARNFFSGGLMPSADFAGRFPDALRVEARWRVDGTHYARTCEAWLRQLDAEHRRIRRLFAEVYGSGDAQRWVGRWRLFFLACAELFAYDGGREWFVTHVRLARP